MTLYLKGYGLDEEKIRIVFPRQPRHEGNNFYELSYYELIVDNIPREAYKHLICWTGF